MILRPLSFLPFFFAVVSCTTIGPQGTDIKFDRKASPETPVIVKLRWKPNEGPPYYTPRGPMTEISITENGRSISVPDDKIKSIEDVWPERVGLLSPTPGDYDVIIPSGVGEGSTEIFKFRDFQPAPDSALLDTTQSLQRR